MLDGSAAQRPRGTLGATARLPDAGQRRGRVFAGCAVLAVDLHLVLLNRIEGWTQLPAATVAAPVSLRAIVAQLEAPPTVQEPAAAPLPAVAAQPAPPKPRPVRRPREPAPAVKESPALGSEASAGSAETSLGSLSASDMRGASAGEPDPPVAAELAGPASAPAGRTGAVAAAAEEPLPAGANAEVAGEPPSAVASAGDRPPPLYRPQLPPAATLRYEVRRGFLRGEGEIRWQPDGDGYRLVLEARIAGLTLLQQTSEGGIDANGLAPVRFVDRRARRSAQAANFGRDAGKVTFSGSSAAWPLLAGSQDRLSWMIQLAGIVAAEPQLLADGGSVAMAVVGGRGDASVWTFRYAGWEQVDTAHGPVRAAKLVRAGRSAYDTTAEIWLDPDRSYLPVDATLRNNAGASEYDLLLDRADP